MLPDSENETQKSSTVTATLHQINQKRRRPSRHTHSPQPQQSPESLQEDEDEDDDEDDEHDDEHDNEHDEDDEDDDDEHEHDDNEEGGEEKNEKNKKDEKDKNESEKDDKEADNSVEMEGQRPLENVNESPTPNGITANAATATADVTTTATPTLSVATATKTTTEQSLIRSFSRGAGSDIGTAVGQPQPSHENQGERLHDEEDEDGNASSELMMDSLPEDSYSIMLVSKLASIPFWTAACVMCVQVSTFLLLCWNHIQSNAGTGNPLGLPSNVTPAVRGTQIFAIVIVALTQDLLRTGLTELHKGYSVDTVGQAFAHVSNAKWILTNGVLRCLEGSLGLMTTFLLIVTADTVIDLLLNFTAMEFVSQLDEIFFALAKQGFAGKQTREMAELVSDTQYPVETILVEVKNDENDPEQPQQQQHHNHHRIPKRKRGKLYRILEIIVCLLFAGWAIVVIRQNRGAYLCQTILVQIDDEFVSSLGAFSGLYDLETDNRAAAFTGRRVVYRDRRTGKAKFAYCASMEMWTFSYIETGDDPDACVDWVLHSEQSETFDILDTQNDQWTVRDRNDREIDLGHFFMECRDCDRDLMGEPACSGRGHCVDAICQCDSGWFGLLCEFEQPCPRLEGLIGPGVPSFPDSFELFQFEDQGVTAYHRPVYINELRPGFFVILVFAGRRWMATSSDILQNVPGQQTAKPTEVRAVLANYFTNDFHAYWSSFVAQAMTQPVDIGTQVDSVDPTGLAWFPATPKNQEHPHEVQAVIPTLEKLPIKLLCSYCDDISRLCLFGGTCVNGQCQCPRGFFGSRCQAAPIGNGHCEPLLDMPLHDNDGGDCCESSCISGDVYRCGKDETGFIDIGYNDCTNASNQWHKNRRGIEGARTKSRCSLALSSNGRILTVGDPSSDIVSLYDANGSEWIQRGRTIEGPIGSHFGERVVMSKGLVNTVPNHLKVDPIRLAASARSEDRGFVRIYDCFTGGCSQKGNDIVFERRNQQSPTILGISDDGQVVAFGGFDMSNLTTGLGFYRFDEHLKQWEPDDLSPIAHSGAGFAIAFSGDFDTVAIRSIMLQEVEAQEIFQHKFRAIDACSVFRYDSQDRSWKQVGTPIIDVIAGIGRTRDPDDFHNLGSRYRLSDFIYGSDPVALSRDGTTLALGYPFSELSRGVRVYSLDKQVAGTWVPRGDTVAYDRDDGFFFGWSVALSGDAATLVIGKGGDASGTDTFIWTNGNWKQFGATIAGGERSSLAVSADGSVLAIGMESIEINHRVVKAQCPEGMTNFRLSLTLDGHPEDTKLDLISNKTGSLLLQGGPYTGSENDDFPYSAAYERSTILAEVCIPLEECTIFTLYDMLDPGRNEEFVMPDGMLPPAVYRISIGDKVNYVTNHLHQAVHRIPIGDGCTLCPQEMRLLKILVRSCVPFLWKLTQGSKQESPLAFLENSQDFVESDFESARHGTCQETGRTVRTYWKEVCISSRDLEQDRFVFHLTAHLGWTWLGESKDPMESTSPSAPLKRNHFNTVVVLLVDKEQIAVDFALVGSDTGGVVDGPPSEIEIVLAP